MSDTSFGAAGRETMRYTTVAIVLHWVIAVLILGQIIGGVWMVSAVHDDNTANDVLAFNAFQLHKTFGILVLVASLARIVWRFTSPRPPAPPMPLWQKLASEGVHYGFYALMIGVPVLGWLMVSVSPREVPTLLFNSAALPWPHLPGFAGLDVDVREALENVFKEAHELLAFAMVGLLFLHVGAALKHHFVDRDGLLARMAPGLFGRTKAPPAPRLGWRAVAAIILAPLALGVAIAQLAGGHGAVDTPAITAEAPATDRAASSATADSWVIVPDDSQLSFTLQYNNKALAGTISDWSAHIRFDPERLDDASARVTLNAGAIATGDGYVDGLIPGEDGLQVSAHPTVTFETTAIRRLEGDEYMADAIITLRGVSQPASFPFSLQIEGDAAIMTGQLVFDRFAFDLGRRNDPGAAYLGPQVVVDAAVRARRAAP